MAAMHHLVERSRTRRGSVITLTIAALAGLTPLLAGCGGSSDPGVAHLSSAKGSGDSSAAGGGSQPESRAGAQQKLVAYAKCMRSNGVPGFPEPVEGGIALHAGPGSGINPGSAQFQTAEKACHKLLPEGGRPSPQMQRQIQERALQFSACMRSHGEPNFPEPEFQAGAVRLRLQAGQGGLNPSSPQFQAAQKACRKYFGPPGSKGGPLAAPPGGEASGQAGGPGGGEHGEGVAATP